MSDRDMTVFFSAAEASGDAHGARLIRSLRARLPEARFIGAAGPKMAAAGCEVVADLTSHASMLGAPLLRIGYYARKVFQIRRAIARLRPAVHVPIDSPAMNWHLAGAAKSAGADVVYYIAPQVWAWAPWRVKKLARLTDEVACILPFEQRYLRDRGVRATYVGHPLMEILPERPDPMPDLLSAWSDGAWRVALLPGSRRSEIRGHTPAMLACAAAIQRRWPGARCTFAAHDETAAAEIRRHVGDADVELSIDKTHQVLAASHFALAASGTVTLEVAHFGVPMVIFYRTSRLLGLLHAAVGKNPRLVGTPHMSLVNILAGHRLVPELIPWNGRIARLREMVMEVMQDPGYLVEVRRGLIEAAASLHIEHGTASENAAELIVRRLEKR